MKHPLTRIFAPIAAVVTIAFSTAVVAATAIDGDTEIIDHVIFSL